MQTTGIRPAPGTTAGGTKLRRVNLAPKTGDKIKQTSAVKLNVVPQVAKATPRAKSVETIRPVSGLAFEQTFASALANTNKSSTTIDTSLFGQMVGAKLTDRRRALLRAIVEKNSRRAFQRADLDAGVLRRLGERGLIEYLDGDLSSETCRFRVTPAGIQAAA